MFRPQSLRASITDRSSGPLRLPNLQRYGLAILSVGVALGASLVLQHFQFRVPSALLLLFAVALSSWYGGPGPAVSAAILSIIGFYWYFVEPVRTIYIYRSEIPFFIVFSAFVMLLSWFGTIRRRVEADLRERADLLNLTHDTVFVIDMEGVIKYWNRGAEERYGWTAVQALGRNVHDLLKTVFPASLDEITAELTRTGRWEGELLHTKKDGSQLVAASRWSLERDKRGRPVAILETNNDVTERKRAEEGSRRLNRELRALSNCNQILLRATDEQNLLEKICGIVCEEAGYRMAFVAYAEQDEAKSVRLVAWAGIEERYLATVGITWADAVRGRGVTGTAIRTGKTCCIQNLETDPCVAPWREICLQHGFRSAIALPLKDEQGNAFGSLAIFSEQPDAFTAEEVRLLEELAGDLAFGIASQRSRAARTRAEQALRQSQAYLSESERLTQTGSWASDGTTREPLYWSEEMFRILGFDPKEGVPTRDQVWQRVHPQDRVSVKEASDRTFREKIDYDVEYRIVLPDGAVKHIHSIGHPILNAGGDVIEVIGINADITVRKRAEEALRRSEAYLAEGQRLSHTGSWSWSPATGQTLYWSEEMFQIFGFNPQEGAPTSEKFWQRIHPEDRDQIYQLAMEAKLAKREYEHEHRIMLPDGTIKHIHVIGHPVLDEKGMIVEYVGTTIDVTERKRTEETLRRSEAYLAEAQRLSHTGTSAHGMNRQTLYWSDEMFRLYNFDPRQGMPTREQIWQRIHPHDLQHFRRMIERTYSEKVDGEFEFRIVLADGTVKHVHVLVHPILGPDGEMLELVGTNIDVTEQKRSERALRRSEAYLAEAQRLTHTGSWAWDVASDKYVYTSEECLRIFGFDPQKGVPTGEELLEKIHPEDRNKWKENFEKSLREKVDTFDDYRIVLPGGTIRHIYTIRHPVLVGAGDVVELMGTSIDITERKRAEEALRLSNAYNRGLIEASLDPLVTIGPDGKIMDVNAATEAATGRSRGELIGTDFCDYFTKPAEARAGYEQVFREGLVRDYPLELRHRDGHVMSVLYNAAVYRDESGEVVGVFAAARDVTERKRAEEALRESETRFRTFVDHTTDAFFMLDFEKGTILDLNRPACESLGYTRQELIGKTPLDFDVDLDRATFESIAQRAVGGETVSFDRHWHRRKDGSTFPVEVHTSVFRHGGHRFLVKVARDISDRIRAEEQRSKLRQLEADLAHLNRVSMLGELAASISHELKQPITATITNARTSQRWLRRDQPDLEEVRQAAERIEKDGVRATEIIDRLRALYKKTPPNREPVDVNEIIGEMVLMLRGEANRFAISIRTDLAADLPKITADRVQLQQVLMNLMLNGIEAMNENGGVLTVKSQPEDGQVHISVSDTGIGLPTDRMNKIFDPFFTTKPQGSGIGLTISRSIIESHSGRIWATPNDARGASFHFCLPTTTAVTETPVVGS